MTIIIGAGISGISASYHLNKQDVDNIVYEKDNDWGGLCGNFKINGYRFDKAIHLSFTEDNYVKNLFAESCEYITHNPLAYNYYKGYWLKHPAQNNLYPLKLDEKIQIISDFVENDNKKVNIQNYEEWLKAQYGNYFSENFPIPYTRKYWLKDPIEMSTTWVGDRMYQPDIKEILKGAFEIHTPNTYYAKEMRYPKKGGYRSFLNHMRDNSNIELNKTVIEIDAISKTIYFEDGSNKKFDDLLSSIPLPEYTKLIKNMPDNVKAASQKLEYTSIALVSIGLNKPKVPKYLWFYIYDEDMLASRCYSPSIKSSDNVPDGCSSFQFEIYFTNEKPLTTTKEDLIEHIIQKSEDMKILNKGDIVVKDCRFIQYGNVTYTHTMEENRKVVLDYLKQLGIKTIGRFGKWEYYWSDQSLRSGFENL